MKFYNYPISECTDISYEPLPPASNPVIRGNILKYAASIVTSFGPIQDFLWHNAGFHLLHSIDRLNDFAPRFDPTVVPVAESCKDGSNPNSGYYQDASGPSSANHIDSLTTIRPPPSTQQSLARQRRYYSVLDFHHAYLARLTTPSDVVATLVPLIRRDSNDDDCRSSAEASLSRHAFAFLETNVDAVTAAAAASTRRYERGEQLGLMDGVPVAVKDEVDVDGCRLRFGTGIGWDGRCLKKEGNEGSKGVKTSWCVKQWMEAGAIILGKTNMHELGIDTTNNNPIHGTPLNPHNSNYYTGGSSGGSGYAVGAGIVPIALGADGGGSIRIPSSYCGIYGLKPTHSRISCWPTQNRCPTNGVVGPMAANMVDLDIAYRVMATNPHSSGAVGNPARKTMAASNVFPEPSKPPSYIAVNNNSNSRIKGKRRRKITGRKVILGIYDPWFSRADKHVRQLCHAAIAHLTTTYPETYTADHSISIPYVSQGQLAHAATILCEIANSTPDDVLTSTSLSPAARVLVAVGRRAPARDLLVAQKMRALLMAHLAHLFVSFRGERGKRDEHKEQDDTSKDNQNRQQQQQQQQQEGEKAKEAEEAEEESETAQLDVNKNKMNPTPPPSPILLLLSPTTPTAGARITNPNVDLRHGVSDGNASFRSMEYTYLANFTGLPALTVPVGYVEPDEPDKPIDDDDGDGQSHNQSQSHSQGKRQEKSKSDSNRDVSGRIPVGMQAMGEWGAEEELIEWGYDMEEYIHLHSGLALELGSLGSLSVVREKGSGSDDGSGTTTGHDAGSGRVLPGIWVDALEMARDGGGKEEIGDEDEDEDEDKTESY